MARARNVKPGFFTNDELAELAFEYRLLFIGLWTLADREGRLEDRPKKIRMSIFPGDDVDVDRGLDALASRGFIVRYQVGDGRYVEILTFAKHQNPHHREPPSTIPARGSGGMDAATTQGKPQAPGPSMGGASPGLDGDGSTGPPGSKPGSGVPDGGSEGGSAVLIPDSGFLIPDSPLPLPGEPQARPASSVATAGEIAIECRSRGVRVQGAGDHRVKVIAAAGVSVETVGAACAEARQSYPDEPVTIGLVLRILERWAKQADGRQFAGAAPPGARGGIDDAALARLQAKLEAEEADRAAA